MALAAIDARLVMTRMAEENEVLDGIDLTRGEWLGIIAPGRQTLDLFAVPLHGAMTGHAFPDGWKRRSLCGLDRCVTVDAFNLQRRMLLVTETYGLRILRSEARYRNENAEGSSWFDAGLGFVCAACSQRKERDLGFARSSPQQRTSPKPGGR